MKKITSVFICLSIFLTMIGCSKEEPKVFDTLAYPLNEQQKEDKGIAEYNYAYNAENVRAYSKNNLTTEIYLYSAPVEESLNEISETEEGYEVDGNYFGKVFPKDVSQEQPIQIGDSYNYMKVYFSADNIPQAQKQTNILFEVQRESIVYSDAFGKGIDYVCYPTSFGYNSEIVIPKRTDNNTFTIKIQLPDLVPDTGSPDYILFKTALSKGEVKSILYTPLIYDANGNWSYANSVKLIEKDSETNTYTVEYKIDKKFANRKDTKYPLHINQSLHLYKSKQPDTSAYENTGDEAGHYLSPYMLLGDKTLKGEGWTFVRYETLNSLNINPDKIISAKYVFHNLFDMDKEVKIGAYAVTADWCSINTRWFNRPPFDEKPISEVIIDKSGDYELDVTSLFKEMIKNKGKENPKYSVQNSFMIRSDTENSNIIFPSGDNGLYSPLLKIVLSE